jgi:leucyl/phenylalanyl-tRNA--protein transferase
MIYRLNNRLAFPNPRLSDEEFVIAVGGDLSVDRLLLAYQHGLFPWILRGDLIEWWCPDPRFVLFPDKLKVAKSLARVIQSERFTVTFDRDFPAVIENCRAVPRPNQPGTWIKKKVMTAFCALHDAGHAHSVEVWQEGELAGGLYGVAVGSCFCGESMFAKVSNASKVGLVTLVRRLREAGCTLIDCQMPTDHLARFGAEPIPRAVFLDLLEQAQTSVTTPIPSKGQP